MAKTGKRKAAPRRRVSARKAAGLAVHIGLNAVDPAHHAGWSGPLSACEADASDMPDIAKRA
jgi:hypothetical protein